jgi:hypothetical protein
LAATEPGIAKSAEEWLEEHHPIGVKSFYAPADSRDSRILTLEAWSGYAKNLRKAIYEEVPLILHRPANRHEAVRRRQALLSLGDSAPHAAFLPLIQEVVKSQDQDRETTTAALHSICPIPQEGLIDYLLGRWGTDLRGQVCLYILRLTDAQLRQIDKEGDAYYVEFLARFSEWWRQHKDTWKYDRVHALRWVH